MSRLTKKLPVVKQITQTKCNYKSNVFGGIIENDKKENAVWLFHNIVEKLAEYENLGSVEDLKGIHQANQSCEKILETSFMVSQNNRLLSQELEVYKRALKNEIPSNYYELEKVENEEQYIDLRLDQARKELEDESSN